jgi:hypothetical protein
LTLSYIESWIKDMGNTRLRKPLRVATNRVICDFQYGSKDSPSSPMVRADMMLRAGIIPKRWRYNRSRSLADRVALSRNLGIGLRDSATMNRVRIRPLRRWRLTLS